MAPRILNIPRFRNDIRPPLLHPSLTKIPVGVFTPEEERLLKEALSIDDNDDFAAVKSAKILESLLEIHPSEPYLMIRVADMRFVLNSKRTASELYMNLIDELDDAEVECDELDTWTSKHSRFVHMDKTRELALYNGMKYAPKMAWNPNVSSEIKPAFKLEIDSYRELRDLWPSFNTSERLDQFYNLHCIETNAIEGTFMFHRLDVPRLVVAGFDEQIGLPKAEERYQAGLVCSEEDAIGILQDTRKALDSILEFSSSKTSHLTPDLICQIHKSLMQTCRVSCVLGGPRESRIQYVNIGMTRDNTNTNVIVNSSAVGGRIQFCPFNEVGAEVMAFCNEYNELLNKEDYDPFGLAAWSNHAFVDIHPFEDGNGRMSRLLSSIPLLKKGLPPLCISESRKRQYFEHLNNLRAERPKSDYLPLATMMCESTLECLQEIR
ncbi:hypothetical protein CPC08DRAFT_767033 [Agrocybe pediades]|nr:hypothetical protein CPC08DRAFT_767033 [Agrocybe pediades]